MPPPDEVRDPVQRPGAGPALPPALFLVALLSMFVAASPARAGRDSLFTSPRDGKFDISGYSRTRVGFVPIVSPVTDPAIGYGVGVALMHLSGPLPTAGSAGQRGPDPNIGGGGGMITDNGSWAGFAGYVGHSADQLVRYSGAAGYMGLELNAYTPAGRALAFSIDGPLLGTQVVYGIVGRKVFLGARYVFLESTVRFTGETLSGIADRELDSRLAVLGPLVQWDSRDNPFTPDRGLQAEVSQGFSGPLVGSDYSFTRYNLIGSYWHPVAATLVAGVHGVGAFQMGRAPFWARPYVELRGVPALRYAGNKALSLEGELRWDLTPRWALDGFGGIGSAFRDWSDFESAPTAFAGGAGFRYLIADLYGLYMGMDVAYGAEEWSLYVIFGNAWLRM